MDAAQLSKLVAEFNYTLAKISKYLKNNQYVYLRAFDSWKDSYNSIAEQLNADKTLTVPFFTLGPIDYSPTGKSIKSASVEKFVKTINHQVMRLEEKIEELHRVAALQLAAPHPLLKFFPRDSDGMPLEPTPVKRRVVVAVPGTEAGQVLFQQGIQPTLDALGVSCFRAARSPLNDADLCELCQELYSRELAIFDLSGQFSHVMLALGLAYGIGKPVIILHGPNETALGKMNNNGNLTYVDAADIKTALGTSVKDLLES